MTFNVREGFVDLPVSIPCGRCIGCKLERSRQWAMRCVHEAQLHEDNCFITLTYNDAHIPYGGTLQKKHFQDFMKRLRKKYADRKISYFHCGEYGEACKQCRLSRRRCTCRVFQPGIGRPHYHALLFGLDFPDRLPYKKSGDGSTLFTSATLSKLWTLGFSTVGALTFESAAYCARYVMKKVTGDPAEDHYTVIEPSTGELIRLPAEYVTMSLKVTPEHGGIAGAWYAKYKSDVYPDDFVVVRGAKMKPPKYYDRIHELDDPASYCLIKESRAAYAIRNKANSTPERLRVREKVKIAQLQSLKRDIE